MISTKELMKRDQVSQMNIRLLQLRYEEDDRKKVIDLNYNEEVEFIITHEKRNKLVAKIFETPKPIELLLSKLNFELFVK